MNRCPTCGAQGTPDHYVGGWPGCDDTWHDEPFDPEKVRAVVVLITDGKTAWTCGKPGDPKYITPLVQEMIDDKPILVSFWENRIAPMVKKWLEDR